jgi:hypothetical protein
LAVTRIGRGARLAPPTDLGEEEAHVFRQTVAASTDRFLPEDLPFLAAYSRAVVLERQTSDELAAARATGKMLSQRLAAYSCAVKSMLGLGARLRLGPLARVSHSRRRPGSVGIGGLSFYETMDIEGDDDAESRSGSSAARDSNGES